MTVRSFFFHFNRQGASRGFPYTVHTAGQCIPAVRVICHVPTETVWRPEKRSNPRGWVKGRGIVQVGTDGIVTVLKGADTDG